MIDAICISIIISMSLWLGIDLICNIPYIIDKPTMVLIIAVHSFIASVVAIVAYKSTQKK